MYNSAFDVRSAFSSELTHYTQPWPEFGRCPTLMHSNEWNLTVRRGWSPKHDIFCDAVSRIETSTGDKTKEFKNIF